MLRRLFSIALSLLVGFFGLAFIENEAHTAETSKTLTTDQEVLVTDQDPVQIMQNLADRAMKLIENTLIDDTEREQNMRILLNDGFNIEAIARFSLGRHWRRTSKEEKAQLLELFEDSIVKTYTARFKGYSGNVFSVLGADVKNDRQTVVHTAIESPNGELIKADWHMQKFKKIGFKIVDVEVEGVRMAVAQRSEFGTIIKRTGSVSGLIEVLQKQVTDNNDE